MKILQAQCVLVCIALSYALPLSQNVDILIHCIANLLQQEGIVETLFRR